MSEADAPPSSDRSDPRSGAGPTDVAPKLILAARAGDPAAFARFVEHWDPHVRRFIHLSLGDPSHTDKAVAAAYVRAYRAMPTYRADHRPGLWLHRIAYLTVADHLRRQARRGPKRPEALESAAALEGLPSRWSPAPSRDSRSLHDAVLATFKRMPLDQRALVLLIDGSRFGSSQVGAAFEVEPEMVRRRLEAGRQALTEVTVHLPAKAPVEPDDSPDRVSRFALATVEVPQPDPRFWPDLGRRLLAEKERPALPSIDPDERLARAHPAEPGFRPSGALNWSSTPDILTPTPATRRPVSEPAPSLEPLRELEPEPRNWRRPLRWTALVLVAVAVVVAAVVIGTSSRTPDGSITARQLDDNMSTAFTSSPYLASDIEIETLDQAGQTVTEAFRVTLASDGSWAVSPADRFETAAYDAGAGTARQVVVVTPDESDVVILASESTGLAPGGPDQVAQPMDVLNDLRLIGPLLRGRPDDRAPASTVDDQRLWTFQREAPTGPDGANQTWRVAVDRTDHLPRSIELHQEGEVVRRVSFDGWEPLSEVPADVFEPQIPAEASVNRADYGFLSVDLAGVEVLGRGPAITPAWLPEGFELAQVKVRGTAPPAARSTAGGTNPADQDVMALAYQRGPERITVTIRSAADPDGWDDPFTAPPIPEDEPEDPEAIEDANLRDLAAGRPSPVPDVTVGDGRFNGEVLHGTVDGAGRARLWGTADELLITVAGDLNTFEARQVLASMR